ncbi:diguanylate cyclase domain-containing protein [Thiobacillus sp.]
MNIVSDPVYSGFDVQALENELERAVYRGQAGTGRAGDRNDGMLLPQIDLSGAIAVAEQIRERILALDLPYKTSPMASQATLSVGVSSSELASVASPAELIRTSDIALYEAKRCGRNQIGAARKTVSIPVAGAKETGSKENW